ncbi:WAS/WASL-interacting protein family member 3-like [Dasypus novemcinctus]|uniref:WAS/WASL-interacting protein family member 3-like n=1 Tax=Dasypus novemcinctus TaxID=9361 RepID=UPI00062A727C|nr:uncharacterized protein LOC105746093 [Dasypus novemcinctus]
MLRAAQATRGDLVRPGSSPAGGASGAPLQVLAPASRSRPQPALPLNITDHPPPAAPSPPYSAQKRFPDAVRRTRRSRFWGFFGASPSQSRQGPRPLAGPVACGQVLRLVPGLRRTTCGPHLPKRQNRTTGLVPGQEPPSSAPDGRSPEDLRGYGLALEQLAPRQTAGGTAAPKSAPFAHTMHPHPCTCTLHPHPCSSTPVPAPCAHTPAPAPLRQHPVPSPLRLHPVPAPEPAPLRLHPVPSPLRLHPVPATLHPHPCTRTPEPAPCAHTPTPAPLRQHPVPSPLRLHPVPASEPAPLHQHPVPSPLRLHPCTSTPESRAEGPGPAWVQGYCGRRPTTGGLGPLGARARSTGPDAETLKKFRKSKPRLVSTTTAGVETGLFLPRTPVGPGVQQGAGTQLIAAAPALAALAPELPSLSEPRPGCP